MTEDDVTRLEETLKLRDILIMQDALDWRLANIDSDDPDDEPGTAFVIALLLNSIVPKRFRLTDTEIELRSLRHHATSKRVLLKELYRAWRTLGKHPRRGKTFPRLRSAKQTIEQLNDVIEQLRTGDSPDDG